MQAYLVVRSRIHMDNCILIVQVYMCPPQLYMFFFWGIRRLLVLMKSPTHHSCFRYFSTYHAMFVCLSACLSSRLSYCLQANVCLFVGVSISFFITMHCSPRDAAYICMSILYIRSHLYVCLSVRLLWLCVCVSFPVHPSISIFCLSLSQLVSLFLCCIISCDDEIRTTIGRQM